MDKTLYKKNRASRLSEELFQNPTAEYRATPFWAWNCKLTQDLCDKEIDFMKEMGLGGFHMHSRVGMAVPYLKEEFMDLIRGCVEKAKENGMLAWLYDEDRWPSGAAGGLVTSDYRYRSRRLEFRPEPLSGAGSFEEAYLTGIPTLLAAYDVVLDDNGCLTEDTRKLKTEDEPILGNKWYAYLVTAGNDPWYNGQAYADLLNKEAIDRFLEVTHEAYRKAVGDEFGKTIPAIFTDEPQFSRKETLNYPTDRKACSLPWTGDLPKTFAARYGYDLTDRLPELFWELPAGKISQARYHYHDHVCDRFTEAFADNVGDWCEKHGINFTGHMMAETTLFSQTGALGECMRGYRKFTIPGIDMLCNYVELATAKQAQSAANQYGREGVLSELYGVTDWDFDFRGHKFQGDWQAALGVTVRVPHLYWASMAGEAKRDYPASIGHQSPWYKDYSYVEDHFARVNAALTRGKPVVKVAVIHPVESYWLHWGPKFQTEAVRGQIESHFSQLMEWLLSGLIDFDFLSESLLPSQVGEITRQLPVGVMNYDTVIVPGLETLRSSTIEILIEFQAKGGKVIFLGNCPGLVDAEESGLVRPLYEKAVRITFDRTSLLEALEPDRLVDAREDNGALTSDLIYRMRQDGGDRWLFLAHLHENRNRYVSKGRGVRLTLKGAFVPTLYDTLTGEIRPIPYRIEGNNTVLRRVFYASDSLLLRLTPWEEGMALSYAEENKKYRSLGKINYRGKVSFTRSEENVLLLDYAEYKLDDEKDFSPAEEILRLDTGCRAKLGMPPRGGHMVQPWVIPPEKPAHKLTLRFTFTAEAPLSGTYFAIEDAKNCELTLDGAPLSNKPAGWFTDYCIDKIPLPELSEGTHQIEAVLPLGTRTYTEWCYLLGNFNVRLEGTEKTLVPASESLGFQSVTTQGLPFYGANLTYTLPVDVPEDCMLSFRCGAYFGSGVKVSLDGRFCGRTTYEPYTLLIPHVSKGSHVLTLELLGNRFNCFGALHNTNYEERWAGPGIWRTGGDRWCDEYRVRDLGIVTSPSVEFLVPEET